VEVGTVLDVVLEIALGTVPGGPMMVKFFPSLAKAAPAKRARVKVITVLNCISIADLVLETGLVKMRVNWNGGWYVCWWSLG
jgi:hypothetical protein